MNNSLINMKQNKKYKAPKLLIYGSMKEITKSSRKRKTGPDGWYWHKRS